MSPEPLCALPGCCVCAVHLQKRIYFTGTLLCWLKANKVSHTYSTLLVPPVDSDLGQLAFLKRTF